MNTIRIDISDFLSAHDSRIGIEYKEEKEKRTRFTAIKEEVAKEVAKEKFTYSQKEQMNFCLDSAEEATKNAMRDIKSMKHINYFKMRANTQDPVMPAYSENGAEPRNFFGNKKVVFIKYFWMFMPKH